MKPSTQKIVRLLPNQEVRAVCLLKKMSQSNNKTEFDQHVDDAQGFIVPYEEKMRSKTQLCNVEEDALQICVLNNKGLSGCEKEIEKYNICRAKELTRQMAQENKAMLERDFGKRR